MWDKKCEVEKHNIICIFSIRIKTTHMENGKLKNKKINKLKKTSKVKIAPLCNQSFPELALQQLTIGTIMT